MDTIRWINLVINQPPLHFDAAQTYERSPFCHLVLTHHNQDVYFHTLLYRLILVPKTQDHPLSGLVESGLFSTHDNIVESERTLTTDNLSDTHVRLLMTDKCNLACTYCYGDAKVDGETLTLEQIKALFDSFSPHQTLSVEFHGNGEPTLALPLIKRATTYLTQRFDHLTLTIQTNGQFDNETAQWLIDSPIHVAFSIDGPKAIQLAQRPAANGDETSFETLIQNIERFHQAGKGFQAICTITEHSLPQIGAIYEFIKSLGMKYIKINPLVKLGRATQSNNPIQNAPNAKDFAKQLAIIAGIAYFDKILIDSDFIPSFHTKSAGCLRCGACSPSIVLNPNGTVIACADASLAATPENNPFIWGHCSVENGLVVDEPRREALRHRNVVNMPACEDCFLKTHCSGACLIENYLETGAMETPSSCSCAARRQFASTYFKTLVERLLPST